MNQVCAWNMKALRIANAQTMKIALRQEISRSDESRYDHRLHGVLLVCQGHSCYEVGEWLGEHPTTIERWVHRFEVTGFQGLHEGQREGRPRRLDGQTWQRVEKDLRSHPRDLGYAKICGTASCSPITCARNIKSVWEHDNASDCSGAWVFAGANPGR